jgi:hypothetical protein
MCTKRPSLAHTHIHTHKSPRPRFPSVDASIPPLTFIHFNLPPVFYYGENSPPVLPIDCWAAFFSPASLDPHGGGYTSAAAFPWPNAACTCSAKVSSLEERRHAKILFPLADYLLHLITPTPPMLSRKSRLSRCVCTTECCSQHARGVIFCGFRKVLLLSCVLEIGK